MRFRQYVKDRVSQLHVQMSVGWDTQAMQECCPQSMTRPEKRAIQEIIDNNAKVLSLFRLQITSRRKEAVGIKWGGSKRYKIHYWQEAIWAAKTERWSEANWQGPNIGKQVQTLSGARCPPQQWNLNASKSSTEASGNTNLENKWVTKHVPGSKRPWLRQLWSQQ